MDNYFLKSKKISCIDTGEVCEGYSSYLKSKHWLLLRKKLIHKDTVCNLCGDKKIGLQIHHLHYKTLGNEDIDNDICVICGDCHKLIHNEEIKLEKLKINNFISLTCTSQKPKASAHQKTKPVTCKTCYYAVKGKGGGKKRYYCDYHCMVPKETCDKYRRRFKKKKKK